MIWLAMIWKRLRLFISLVGKRYAWHPKGSRRVSIPLAWRTACIIIGMDHGRVIDITRLTPIKQGAIW